MARWSLHPSAQAQAQIMLIPTAFGSDAQAPSIILNAGSHLCGFEPLLDMDVDTLAVGHATTITDEPPYSMCEAVISQYLQSRQWPVLLPAAMPASWGAIRGVWKQHPQLTVVHWSAHANLLPTPDLTQSDDDPGYSPLAWVERLYHCQIPIVYLGLRSVTAQGSEWIKRHQSPVFWSHQTWTPEHVIAELSPHPVFLVIDASVFDPALVDSVAAPEPGGVTWSLLIDTCAALFASRSVLGISLGGLAVTSRLQQAARLLARLLNWLLACYGSQLSKPTTERLYS